MMGMKTISTQNAPAAIGPYSQGMITGNLIFTSGQIPINPVTGNIEVTDIEGQADQAIRNIRAVLESAGTDLSKVVKTTCFLQPLMLFMKNILHRCLQEVVLKWLLFLKVLW